MIASRCLRWLTNRKSALLAAAAEEARAAVQRIADASVGSASR
jgi:hypothetical protein